MRARFLSIGLLLAAGMLAGCAQPAKPLYYWDGYQAQLYEYLKNEGASPEDQVRELEAQALKARAADAALPPGFRAHLGVLYLRVGRGDEARQQFEAEKAAFPEAAHYMDFLLKRMSKA
ncbi:MAG TPA: DUF4810 domain-containing protein [Burkholderiaceae bacterium]|nr:DUF4810 domain-containing protein [Burkholderiaceae bacterium]